MKAKFACAVIISMFLSASPGISLASETQKSDPVVNEGTTETQSRDVGNTVYRSETQNIFANQNFEFGLMYWDVDYKEDISPQPGKSTENGWLPGFYLGWNYNKKNAVYSKIFLEFSFGDVTYAGTDQSGTIPITYSANNHQFFFRGELNIGYNFSITRSISIKPYVGYGYRYWARGQTGFVAPNVINIQERYYWNYVPVGIATDFKISERVFIEPNAGARFMFYGKMEAEFSDFDPGYNNPSFKLGNRIGYYAEIPLRYKFSQHWSVVVKPWYAYDEIGQSDTVDITYMGTTVGSAYEPPSRTHQYGANVGFVVSY